MKGLLTFFAKNRLVLNLTVVFIIVGGFYYASGIKLDLFPVTETDAMMISTSYSGAGARDVELNVTIPIEDKLNAISGIDNYQSTSNDNSSRILVIIDENIGNKQEVKDEIRRVMSSMNNLPDDAGDVNVRDLSPAFRGVYELGICLDKNGKLNEDNLYQFADKLKRDLLRLDNVSEVNIRGDRTKEVKINVNPAKLREFDVSLTELTSAIKNRNIRIAGGSIETARGEFNIVTTGQFKDPKEVGDIIIRSNFEGNTTKIKDVADIYFGYSPETEFSRINGKKGIFVTINKKKEADIVKTAKDVEKFIAGYKERIPDGITIDTVRDESRTIQSLMKMVAQSAVFGFILVFITLFAFFMDIKVSFWTAFGLPFVTIITVAVMRYLDYSLNIVTLGTIAMLLGILVDDGIVVSEIIAKNLSKGMAPLDAIYNGIREVAAPVFVSIFTNILAFMPLLTIKGMMGKFIGTIPIVVTITLIFSFIEAIFFLSAHLSHIKHKHKKDEVHGASAAGDMEIVPKRTWFHFVEEGYRLFLKNTLKFRYLVVLMFVGILIFTIFISADSFKKFRMMMGMVSDSFTFDVVVDEKYGTSLAKTAAYVDLIESDIRKSLDPGEIISIQSRIGTRQSNNRSLSGNHTNEAFITLNMPPESDRSRNNAKLLAILKQNVNTEKYKNITTLNVRQRRMGFDTGNPVEIRLLSNDEKEALKYVGEIKDYLGSIPGVINIEDNQEALKSEIQIKFDYDRMAIFGVSPQTVASAVRTAIYGSVATTLTLADKETDFRVILDENSSIVNDERKLLELTVPSSQGRQIKLKEFAFLDYNKTVYSIQRRNGYRVYSVTAELESERKSRPGMPERTAPAGTAKRESADKTSVNDKKVKSDINNKKTPAVNGAPFSTKNGTESPKKDKIILTSMQVTSKVMEKFSKPISQSTSVSIEVGGEAEQSKNALFDIIVAFLIALFCIYFTLVILYKNFTQPFIVMITIPFGISGALLAFYAHGMSIDFFGLVGILGLSGVVINDSIVMIDFLNKQFSDSAVKSHSSHIREVISLGAKERLRPIILTTATTTIGLMPSIYGLGGASPFITPIALAIGYGLLFGTTLTLLFIPALYMIRLDVSYFLSAVKRMIFKSSES